MAQFEAHVRERDGLAVIDLSGEINVAAEAGLDRAYAGSGAGPILLNFTDVEYMNSTGIALIVGVLARARRERRQVLAFGLSDHYREIFQITRLSDFMPMFESEGSALAGMSAPTS